MIRITRQTDYGIILLAYLASRPPEHILTARDAAQECRLPVPMVSKILKMLAHEGILASHRGVKGGYSLGRLAERITIGDIIGALEGPIGMTECASNPGSCEQEPVCPVRINWQRISLAVRGALEKIPLSEMMASPRPPLLRVGPPFPADDASGKGEDVPATAPAGQGRALETP
ncbi:MAG: SUF system Fe-S cluster assembly regulator [Acidobacteriia bacterium]|nr:SUF system Fe-S cluster assembly regulator [Terriglobia bacterium]